MAYSRRNKKNKKIHRKRTYRKNKKTLRGGSCGCNRITGGSPYLSELSPQTHYPYNSSIQNDPNNYQLSTRMEGVDNIRAMTGGRKNNKSCKNRKQKKIIQTGGLSYSDFSIMNPGVPTNDNPSFMQNLLSTNQPNPNIPMVTQGIRYYV